ncbi:MAG TPA: class I SAM-dependent methyltransferase [Candidatus Binataceae bacterium]|nr:class I SAM-dependent methyltransferase [Candidatus Binataceae bacterium]
MIEVLQDWKEIGNAILSLQRQYLPLHPTVQKNWDHFIIYEMVKALDRGCSIVDLGCNNGDTLAFLTAMGFRNLEGVDLHIPWRGRARQLLKMWRGRALNAPYRMRKADITDTSLKSESFDVAVSLSTVEHGVNRQAFLREVSRLLKPGGLLLVTTDYWEEKMPVAGEFVAFGQKWEPFSRDDVQVFVQEGQRVGLSPMGTGSIPDCREKMVFWNNADYTFVAMIFRKTERSVSDPSQASELEP